MNAINVDIVRSPFMPLFLVTTLMALALVVLALFDREQPGAMLAVAGGVLYVVGMFAVTMAVNVPLNDALAAADPSTAQGAALWTRYVRLDDVESRAHGGVGRRVRVLHRGIAARCGGRHAVGAACAGNRHSTNAPHKNPPYA